jgi:outer membrane protein
MFRRVIFLFALLCSILTSAALADELPLWEAGFGFTGLSLPDYRGSDEQRLYVFPLPYLVYRGEILRMDRKGLYGILFRSERLQMHLSADAGVPVKSDRNAARSGMPDLDPTLQIGPSLEICLSSQCDGNLVVQLHLPVRAVFATDFSYLSNVGFVANPQITFDFYDGVRDDRRRSFGLAFGPLYATRKFHEYYYEVSPQYAVLNVRPAYDAREGYSGTLIILTASKRFSTIWFGAFARYDNLSGAVFADSPLMRTKQSVMAGFGIAWVFGQSQILVNAPP